MKYVLYILVGLSAYLGLANGFGLFSESGRTGQYLGGTLSTTAILYLVGGLITAIGLIGLFINKNWGKVVSAAGMGMIFLGSILMMTTGTIPLLQLSVPLISTILLFVLNKK